MLKVDKEKCIGCGNCEYLCPEIFEIRDGKSALRAGADLEKNHKCIKEAINACPVNAIWQEENNKK